MPAKYKTACLLILISFCVINSLFSQTCLPDSSKEIAKNKINSTPPADEQVYTINNTQTLIYTKPRHFGFVTNLPHDALGLVVTGFKRENIKPLLITAGITVALLLADRYVAKGVQQFSGNIHFRSDESYKNLISIETGETDISIYKAPKNLNTVFYQMGQGFPGLLIGAGLFTYGKIHHDYRALSTASQLAETFILMGVGTQVLKRITGRQSPSNATESGGNWHFFPSFKNYQTQTPNYDAFPSGHLATLISTVTVLADNYPEKKYIRPVGYSVTGLVALAMINNNVHWASDYPLAIALGYLCARQVVKRNRKVVETLSSVKPKRELSYTLNYSFGRLMPGVVYRF
jgi:hypothetical protein